jgi:murein DD-endopeptidase MepM/ murein hydrolase activator NlpD
MAEPAWVLRTRRMRARRSRSRRGAVLRLRWMSAVSAQLQKTVFGKWLIWFFGLLSSVLLSPRTRRAGQAVSAARAVLDGQAISISDPSPEQQPDAPRIKEETHAFRVTHIPLRYAAHGLIALLAIAVIWSDASQQAGVLQLSSEDVPLPITLASTDTSFDQQVHWVVPAEAPSVLSELSQPELRSPDPSFEPVFVMTHELSEGDVLGEIARDFQVSVDSIFWSNNLDDGDVLAAGQVLRIPRLSGVPYIIQEGDTLEGIAERFRVSTDAITLLRTNGVSKDAPLPVGVEIYIPGGVIEYSEDLLARLGGKEQIAQLSAVAAGIVRESDTNLRTGPGRDYPRIGYLEAGRRLELIGRYKEWVKLKESELGIGWVRGDLIGLTAADLDGLPEDTDFPPPPPVWVWPARGTFTSSFGWRSVPFRSFHDGIDIANAAGTYIYAARTGRVIEAGWCSGFGYCVKIDHGDGMSSTYGHMLKQPVVSAGETVEVGQHIGYMGSTFDRSGGGYSTGVHLHFTVKLNGMAVNPMNYLP